MTGNEHISQEDLALHALQALPEAEASAVRAHVAECAACRGELGRLAADAALLGLSVEQKALPAGSRDRFLGRVAADAEAAQNTIREEARGKVLAFPKRGWIPWTIAAALAALAVMLGVGNYRLNRELGKEYHMVADLMDQSSKAERALAVLTSQSAQHVLLTASKTPPEPTGRAVYLAESGGLIFQGSHLKPVETGKAYELWVIPVSGKPIAAGVFWPDATGNASVVMPPLPKGVEAKAFGVTIEKAEGSDTPTAPIILAGATATGE
jgi:anti-sigma-K factor RskA